MARDTIKSIQFLAAIASNLIIKIQGEGITGYRAAVISAQTLHEILNNEKYLHSLSSMFISETNFADRLREIF